jgi:carbonic anhydrase
MGDLNDLLARNRTWAASMVRAQPDFFASLVALQSPRYLWIGCSDSRVPANEIVNLPPGELFVHRNVANVVVHTDLNCLSVLQFAIDVLGVEHIIVCGHYGCGGIKAAWKGQPLGLIDNWLRHVQDIATRHRRSLEAMAGEVEPVDCLSELNVIEQAMHVCRTTIVQDAWHRRQPLFIHGLIYDLHDGLLRDLGITVGDNDQIETKQAAAIEVAVRRHMPA